MPERHFQLGTIVTDRARNQALQIVGRDGRTAEEHPHIDVDDPMLQLWGVTEASTVWKCVFLPDGEGAVSTPQKTYAYPEERLVRCPVEAALPGDSRRVETAILVDFLAAVFQGLPADEEAFVGAGESWVDTVHTAIAGAHPYADTEVPPEVIAQAAYERAQEQAQERARRQSGGETR